MKALIIKKKSYVIVLCSKLRLSAFGKSVDEAIYNFLNCIAKYHRPLKEDDFDFVAKQEYDHTSYNTCKSGSDGCNSCVPKTSRFGIAYGNAMKEQGLRSCRA